jgi:hypothetical protein
MVTMKPMVPVAHSYDLKRRVGILVSFTLPSLWKAGPGKLDTRNVVTLQHL